MKALSYICILLFTSFPVKASSIKNPNQLLPMGSQLSYMVFDVNKNRVLLNKNSQLLLSPASLQKLLIATASTLQLGNNFRFQTQLLGDPTKQKGNVYQGDLTLRFDGDPTFRHQDLGKLLQYIKRSGINEIQGNISIESGAYNGALHAEGVVWDDLRHCYAAPLHSIVINKNCISGTLSIAPVTNEITINIDPIHPVHITQKLQVVTVAERERRHCSVQINPLQANHYQISGCISDQNTNINFELPINSPENYAMEVILNELHRLNIKITGRVLQSQQISEQLVLVTHYSDALPLLISEMIKNSDNLFADSLLKTLARHYYQQPGNFENGVLALQEILVAHGINFANSKVFDGSGLSRYNLTSAQQLMELLIYIYQQDDQLGLIKMLPISGVDGTLAHYPGVTSEKLINRIQAKSGSMSDIANLMGVINTRYGPRLFVIIINGYHYDAIHPNRSHPEFYRRFFETLLDFQ